MKKCVALLVVLLLLAGTNTKAQIPNRFSLQLGKEPSSIPVGSGIADVIYHNSSIWIGTGSGVARTDDGGNNWYNFREEDGIGKGSISAMAFKSNTIWIATAFDTLTDRGILPAGGGLSYSDDNGMTWTHVPQPGVTEVQNITYDISFVDSTIWITSFGGGLSRSDNWGMSWQVVTPDSLPFNPDEYLNHRAFSTIYADSILWVGTAGGVNRSTDKGETWVNLSHQNQAQPISGNFVVALAYQVWKGRKILWAATREADDPDEFRGISFSEDFGYTWTIALPGVFAHNFAFDDSVVFAASDNGLFKSIDFGQTWASFPIIADLNSGEQLFTHRVFSVTVSPGPVLWLGSSGGLAKTQDNGNSWRVFRSFETLLDQQNVSETYAYPNPFSPLRHSRFRGEGHVRFHYRVEKSGSVSISVYDFAMALVRRVEQGVFREGNAEYDAVWDGKNDFGEPVANGVYFYRVELPGSEVAWGKVIVMD